MNSSDRKPSWAVSLVPFIFLVAVLVVVIKVFGVDALSGGSQVALLMSAAVVCVIAMLVYHQDWKVLEDAISDNIRSIGSATIILLLIGAVAGSWMVSGVVPTLICYGMKVITPKIFLFACCIISALVSLMTGSSWTTIATIGVALIGIGTAQGFSAGWTAGAIISGAYFGDKISPLSDTTVLASSTSGTSLFTHIKYMMLTTVPSISIALIVFLLVSLFHESGDVTKAAEFSASLNATFNISPWLLIVPVLTALMIARKAPAIVTLFGAAMIAGIAALISQPHIIWEIANGSRDGFTGSVGFLTGFKGLFMSYYGETAVSTGSEALDSLVATRGMTGMLNTVFLIFCSVTFGGTLMGSGMLRSLTELITRFVHKTASVVAATVGTGVFCNITSGDQYLSIILTSSFFKDLYPQKGLEARLLSRSVEDSATVTSVLIPWNSCGMTQATVLNVATMTYLPYCIFNLISPFMSIFVALIGFKIVRREPGDYAVQSFEDESGED